MTTAGILATICAGSLLLLIYPYVIYPHLLRLLPRRPVTAAANDLSASLLFCAFNEAKGLPARIDNLRALKRLRPGLQILAYDDNSSDRTFELLSAHPDLLTVVRGPGRTGKAAGMKQLVKQATGDILIFTDADGRLADDAVERLMPYFADPTVGGVCGVLRCSSGSSVTAQVGRSYWGLDENLRRLESDTGNVMGAMGSLFAVRRSLYPEFPDTVADDFTVSMSVVFQGRRLIWAPDVVVTHESCADRAEEIRRKRRIGARAYHSHQYMRPNLRRMSAIDRFKYISRKQIRWFGGLFLALAVASGLGAVAMLSPLAAAILGLLGIAGVLAAGRLRGGYAARIGEALGLIVATFAGVVTAMRGQTVTTWVPADSARSAG